MREKCEQVINFCVAASPGLIVAHRAWWSVCVDVCVCETERERERGSEKVSCACVCARQCLCACAYMSAVIRKWPVWTAQLTCCTSTKVQILTNFIQLFDNYLPQLHPVWEASAASSFSFLSSITPTPSHVLAPSARFLRRIRQRISRIRQSLLTSSSLTLAFSAIINATTTVTNCSFDRGYSCRDAD